MLHVTNDLRGTAIGREWGMEADDVELVARIYDSALDPDIWPDLLLRIAERLGARGAFIFEVRLDGGREQVVSRLFSSNYDPDIVADYLARFNALELADQGRFAELSQKSDPVDLVSDIFLKPRVDDLLAQENTRAMMAFGLKHRAGALLNKDLTKVDRFALQYGADRGPITEGEKRKAAIFLPHIAKAIGLARPLEERLGLLGIFEEMLRDADQGIAILSPRGKLIYANAEFDRIVEAHGVIRRTAGGGIRIVDEGGAGRFRELVEDGGAHGRCGARARKEAVVLPLGATGAGLFVEICPVEQNRHTGRLGAGCRLVTIIDSSRPVRRDIERIRTFYDLSASESDILDLAADGRSNQEIADIRGRALDTVKSQMKSLMRKTNSENRMDLVHMVRNLSSAVSYKAAP